jgi:hypothetical protein
MENKLERERERKFIISCRPDERGLEHSSHIYTHSSMQSILRSSNLLLFSKLEIIL